MNYLGKIKCYVLLLLFMSLTSISQSAQDEKTSYQRPEWTITEELPSGQSGKVGVGTSYQTAVLNALESFIPDNKYTSYKTENGSEILVGSTKIGNAIKIKKYSNHNPNDDVTHYSTTLEFNSDNCKYTLIEESSGKPIDPVNKKVSESLVGYDDCNFSRVMKEVQKTGLNVCAQTEDRTEDQYGLMFVLICN